MKIVLDTNIWLSGLFWEGEASKIIEFSEKNKIKIIISQEILEEIREILNRETKFMQLLDNKKSKIEDLIRTILSIAQLTKKTSNIRLIKKDPDDNIIIETARDAKAKYIITYDKHLLEAKEFKGIKIKSPEEFLEQYNKNIL